MSFPIHYPSLECRGLHTEICRQAYRYSVHTHIVNGECRCTYGKNLHIYTIGINTHHRLFCGFYRGHHDVHSDRRFFFLSIYHNRTLLTYTSHTWDYRDRKHQPTLIHATPHNSYVRMQIHTYRNILHFQLVHQIQRGMCFHITYERDVWPFASAWGIRGYRASVCESAHGYF